MKVLNAKSEDVTPAEFQKILTNCSENEYFDSERTIYVEWKEFFIDFYARFDELLKSVNKLFMKHDWCKSLNKIQMICKKHEDPYNINTFDYFCLEEELCIVCKEKSHWINPYEELA